jgi:hypothetical protein
MIRNLFLIVTAVIMLCFPNVNFAQAPSLGRAASFVLFSSNGAVTNTGITHLTGNVGTNSGSSTGFGNIDGVMHDGDSASAHASTDLLAAYNLLNSATPTFFPSTSFGNGDTLIAGIYFVSAASTINLYLTLNAQNNANAVFIFQIGGSLSASASAKIRLINGAKACNVFWKVEGLVSIAAGATMRGNIVANNAAINMYTGDTLEGRAFSTNGAVTVDGLTAFTPIGCSSPYLTGPTAPTLATAGCFAIFSSNGSVTNTGVTHVTGDIGTNVGLTVGYDTLLVTGKVHLIPDGATATCAADLLIASTYLTNLTNDIELLYPAQFGKNLTLTPHTYRLSGLTTFTDTLFLNAEGNANAVFVIHVYGAIATSTYAKVILLNGAQAKNVYWKVDGAVDINNYSIFNGTIVSNGAISITQGATLNGRALTTVGALATAAITAISPGCGTSNPTAPNITTQPTNQTACSGSSASFTVVATGSSLTYKWRKGTVNLTNGGGISGADSSVLTINPVGVSDAATNYNVIVSGSVAPNDTSVSVSLIINLAPAISTQPTNQLGCVGGSVSFPVIATGSGLSYQWRKGTVNLVNGGNISGATTATLTINPMAVTDTASNYNVVITGTCTPAKTSTNASLALSPAPVVTTQPSGQIACTGSSVSFPVVATGSGLTYQWRKGLVNLTNGGNISGANTATLTINPVSIADTASNYNVIITGCSQNVTTANASLAVNITPAINTQPVNVKACVGKPAIFTVVAVGTALTYQWKKGTVNLVNGGNISGATSATLTINPMNIVDTAYNYNVVVSGTCAPAKTSANAALSPCGTGVSTMHSLNANQIASFYPNPWTNSLVVTINDASVTNSSELRMFNVLGVMVLNITITEKTTTLETNFPAGVYLYQVTGKNKTVQSGRLVSEK